MKEENEVKRLNISRCLKITFCLTGGMAIVLLLFDVSRIGFLWACGYLSNRDPFFQPSLIMLSAEDRMFYERNELAYQVSVCDLDFHIPCILLFVFSLLYSRRYSTGKLPRFSRKFIEKAEKERRSKIPVLVGLSIIYSSLATFAVLRIYLCCAVILKKTGGVPFDELAIFLPVVSKGTEIVPVEAFHFCRAVKGAVMVILDFGAILCAMGVYYERLQHFVERIRTSLSNSQVRSVSITEKSDTTCSGEA